MKKIVANQLLVRVNERLQEKLEASEYVDGSKCESIIQSQLRNLFDEENEHVSVRKDGRDYVVYDYANKMSLFNLKIKRKKIRAYYKYKNIKEDLMSCVSIEIEYLNNEIKNGNMLLRPAIQRMVDLNNKADNERENRLDNEAQAIIDMIEGYGISKEDLKNIMSLKERYQYDLRGKVEKKLGYYL